MCILAANKPQVKGNARIAHESGEELVAELGVEGADLLGADWHVPEELAATRAVDGGHDERLVERDHDGAEAANSALVSKGLAQGLAHDDARVLDGVVIVDVGVSLDAQRQVDERVSRERGEHVVKEAHAGLDVGDTGAVEVDRKPDVRLFGGADYLGGPGHASSLTRMASASRSASFSGRVPTVILRQFSRPGA